MNKPVRITLAILHFVAYFGIMALTFTEGISAEHIFLAIGLYVVSSELWAEEFMYLTRGFPFMLLTLFRVEQGGRGKRIGVHIVIVVLTYGLLCAQFLLR